MPCIQQHLVSGAVRNCEAEAIYRSADGRKEGAMILDMFRLDDKAAVSPAAAAARGSHHWLSPEPARSHRFTNIKCELDADSRTDPLCRPRAYRCLRLANPEVTAQLAGQAVGLSGSSTSSSLSVGGTKTAAKHLDKDLADALRLQRRHRPRADARRGAVDAGAPRRRGVISAPAPPPRPGRLAGSAVFSAWR